MGIFKIEEIVAWRDGNRIICDGCGDPGEAVPLSEDNFDDDDVVVCDVCDQRIK